MVNFFEVLGVAAFSFVMIYIIVWLLVRRKQNTDQEVHFSSTEFNQMREENKDYEFIAYLAELEKEVQAFKFDGEEVQDVIYDAMQNISEVTDAIDKEFLALWGMTPEQFELRQKAWRNDETD